MQFDDKKPPLLDKMAFGFLQFSGGLPPPGTLARADARTDGRVGGRAGTPFIVFVVFIELFELVFRALQAQGGIPFYQA